MSKRATFWLAWFACGLYLVIAIVTLLFQGKNASSNWTNDIFHALVLLTFAIVGSLVASRRPRNPIGWLFCVSVLLWASGNALQEYAVYALRTVPGAESSAALIGVFGGWAVGLGWDLMLTFLLLLFPNGHLPGPRWRLLAWLIVGLLCAWTLAVLLAPTNPNGPDPRLTTVRNPLGIAGVDGLFDLLTSFLPLGLFASSISCIVAVVLRFRRVRGEERQQLKWFTYGMALSLLMLVVIAVLTFSSVNPNVPDAFFYLAVICIPISAGIAILKYRLYDIDVLINRTLVYGVLTLLVVGIYVLVVGYLGALFRTSGNLLIELLATALVAVLFQPLRVRLQRGINRLFYGQRDEPYAVIERLGRRLEATLAPDAVLPTIVETAAQALKLPYVAIQLTQEGELVIAASYGKQKEELLVLPLVFQRETIGQLLLAPRAPGEGFTPADGRLFSELSRQVSLAAHAVRLTSDLQRSNEHLIATRTNLVIAQEEERRRLRRDLHDGLGPTLAALTLKVGAARKLLAHNPAKVETLLLELNSDIETTVADIRRLVYNLRPPALDDLGLIGAIRERVAQDRISKEMTQESSLLIRLEAPEQLPTLPAAVEVAAYRIVQEALTNIVRHAHASHCHICLALDDALTVEICDDGIGIAESQRQGVGTRSMHERATELGGTLTIAPGTAGGTRVLAWLPLTERRS